ncbi:MAG: hypothetical protein ACLFM8_06490 [Halobacteriales archaeon]
MDRVTLAVPSSIVEALPEGDGGGTARDMERAVAGWEEQLNRALSADDAGPIVDLIERFEDRWERYDGYVVELRAWGQSPIYAMAWRDLHAALIDQLYEHESLTEEIDRERHARIVKDGIRSGP